MPFHKVVVVDEIFVWRVSKIVCMENKAMRRTTWKTT